MMRKDGMLRGLPVAVLAAVLSGSAFGVAPVMADGDHRAEFQAAAAEAFTAADVDGSGELSAAEFVNFHEILRAGHPGPGHGHGPHGPGF